MYCKAHACQRDLSNECPNRNVIASSATLLSLCSSNAFLLLDFQHEIEKCTAKTLPLFPALIFLHIRRSYQLSSGKLHNVSVHDHDTLALANSQEKECSEILRFLTCSTARLNALHTRSSPLLFSGSLHAFSSALRICTVRTLSFLRNKQQADDICQLCP